MGKLTNMQKVLVYIAKNGYIVEHVTKRGTKKSLLAVPYRDLKYVVGQRTYPRVADIVIAVTGKGWKFKKDEKTWIGIERYYLERYYKRLKERGKI